MRLLVILSMVFLTSCVTGRGFERYANKHPQQLAELCDKEFPCEVTGTDTVEVYIDTSKAIYLTEEEREYIIDSILSISVDTTQSFKRGVNVGVVAGYNKAKEECKKNPVTKVVKVTEKIKDTRELEIKEGRIADLTMKLGRIEGEKEELEILYEKRGEQVRGMKRDVWIGWGVIMILIGVIFRKPILRLLFKI